LGRQVKHPKLCLKTVDGFSRACSLLFGFSLFVVLLLGISTVAFGQEGTGQENKDVWDKLSAVSGFVSGIAVAVIGGVATYIYNERQRRAEDNRSSRELAVQRVQTVQTFLPHLASQNELEKRAALLAINYLDDAKLASELATLFRGEGAVSALAEIAASPNQEHASFARRSLGELFDLLRSSVVFVRVGGGQSAASGFVARSDGLIMTVSLIVQSATEEFSVQFPGESSPRTAQLLKNAPDLGLTLLTVERVEGEAFHPLPIDETLPAANDEVFALNYSYEQAEWAPIVGRVVGMTEQKNDSLVDSALIEAYLQEHDPGFAGMPVVNGRGSVIGIGYAADLPSMGQARKSLLIPATNAAHLLASISSSSDRNTQ